MKDSIIVDIKGMDKVVFKENSSLEDLVKKINASEDIIAALINNEVVELNYILKEDIQNDNKLYKREEI